MRFRSLATVLTAAIAGSFGAIGELTPAVVPTVLAQDFRDHIRADHSYMVSHVYDRVTDSTLVAASLSSTSRPFGLGSTAWLFVSFSFPGRRLLASPAFAELSLESWTQSRGGWAFAHPRELRVEGGKARLATIPASEYVKRPVYLFDRGRREELAFRVKAEQLAALAGQPELVLKAGGATIRLDARRMARLRAFLEEMTVRDRASR
jgi:hypothetical protein